MECKLLLRNHQAGAWVIHVESMTCLISGAGITIRNFATQSLQCDLPTSGIMSIQCLAEVNMLRIKTCQDMDLAVQFTDPACIEAALGTIRSDETLSSKLSLNSHTGSSEGGPPSSNNGPVSRLFPNLCDPATQEVLVRLMFSDEFGDYIEHLSCIMDSMSVRIPRGGIEPSRAPLRAGGAVSPALGDDSHSPPSVQRTQADGNTVTRRVNYFDISSSDSHHSQHQQ